MLRCKAAALKAVAEVTQSDVCSGDSAHQVPWQAHAHTLMSLGPLICLECSLSFSTKCAHVFSMPFLTDIGFAPALTACKPKWMSSLANTDAVVVPSPAESFVLPATSLISCAPAFSTASSSSMALAMETPSLITYMQVDLSKTHS